MSASHACQATVSIPKQTNAHQACKPLTVKRDMLKLYISCTYQRRLPSAVSDAFIRGIYNFFSLAMQCKKKKTKQENYINMIK